MFRHIHWALHYINACTLELSRSITSWILLFSGYSMFSGVNQSGKVVVRFLDLSHLQRFKLLVQFPKLSVDQFLDFTFVFNVNVLLTQFSVPEHACSEAHGSFVHLLLSNR